MLEIRVLDPGGAACGRFKVAAKKALARNELAGTVVCVTDPGQFGAQRPAVTPALLVDGKVVCAGRFPTVHEVTKMLAGWVPEGRRRCC